MLLGMVTMTKTMMCGDNGNDTDGPSHDGKTDEHDDADDDDGGDPAFICRDAVAIYKRLLSETFFPQTFLRPPTSTKLPQPSKPAAPPALSLSLVRIASLPSFTD